MNFSDDRIIVSPDQTRECKGSSPIPTDLIIEIFSRLPAKSVARYHCLSKFWYKVISSQYFKDLFAARSSARPQILFLKRNESGILFFSASHPSEKSSDNVATTRLTHYPLSSRYNPHITVPINGLVCVTECFDITYFDRMFKAAIYNPSTGEFLDLPTRRILVNMRNFLVYDTTEKRLKVLSLHHPAEKNLEWGDMDNVFVDTQILTLETNELSWRMIECCKPHSPIGNEICINNVLYYRAFGVFNVQLLVCFDVSSETFRFVKIQEPFNEETFFLATHINYNGKLGMLIHEESNYYSTGENKRFALWILKDAETYEWSKHVYVLPASSLEICPWIHQLRFVGMIGTNEIILFPRDPRVSHCLFYYNIEEDTIRKLNIQGMEGLTTSLEVEMFLNHVEAVSVLKLLN